MKAERKDLMLQVGGPELRSIIEYLPEEKCDDEFEAAVTALDKHFGSLPDPTLAYQRLREARQ